MHVPYVHIYMMSHWPGVTRLVNGDREGDKQGTIKTSLNVHAYVRAHMQTHACVRASSTSPRRFDASGGRRTIFQFLAVLRLRGRSVGMGVCCFPPYVRARRSPLHRTARAASLGRHGRLLFSSVRAWRSPLRWEVRVGSMWDVAQPRERSIVRASYICTAPHLGFVAHAPLRLITYGRES